MIRMSQIPANINTESLFRKHAPEARKMPDSGVSGGFASGEDIGRSWEEARWHR